MTATMADGRMETDEDDDDEEGRGRGLPRRAEQTAELREVDACGRREFT